jgi:hypothetical protein
MPSQMATDIEHDELVALKERLQLRLEIAELKKKLYEAGDRFDDDVRLPR